MPLAEAIRDLHFRKATGDLRVRDEGREKVLHLRAGEIVGVTSNLPEDTLEEAAVRWGLLDRDAARAAAAESGDPGRALVESGTLDEEGLADFLQRLQQESALGLFLWKEGEIEFTRGDGGEPEGTGSIRIPDLVLEGIRRNAGFDGVRERLLWADPVLKVVESPPFPLDSLNLHPQEGYLFSLVDGRAKLKQILTLSPLGEEETIRLLYAFLVLGVLRVQASAGDRPFSIRRFGEEQERAAERIEDIVMKLRSIHRKLGDLDDLQVLGLPPNASEDQINRSYQDLILKYRPDRFPSEVRKQCRRELDVINARIASAYLALTETGPPDEAAASGPVQKVKRLRSREEIEAERSEAREAARELIQRAKMAERSRDYHTAIQYAELATRREPDEASHHAYHAQLLLKNPQWTRRAEAALQRAVEIEPDSAEYHWQLAQLYLRSNVSSRARAELEKVAELDTSRADEVKALLKRLK